MSEDAVTRILRRDPRYGRAAYDFVRAALHRAVHSGDVQHVSPRDLLESIRELALEQFGPLARTVLGDWGVHRTSDFGEIVFNLVDEGELGKTDDDHLADFDGVFEFEDAFPLTPGDVRVHAPPGEGLDDEDDDDDDADDVSPGA